jgi:hypothetical protein
MIDFNAFSTEIFQILRSYEKEIVLYDENGTRVFEPGDARRMYVIGDNLLVSIVEDGDNSALKFYLSPSFNLSQVEGLLDTLRTISVQSNLLFHVKKYNKEIKPKDFAMQATIEEQQENHMNIMEGLYGTSKSSYLKLENARMIVRHSARVNERVIGDRGRHIQAIFVENQEGERLRFPVNMLSGARAMTQHVSNGGTFADEVGSQIIRMARDFSDLAQVTGHINVMPGIAEAAKKKEPKIEAYGVKGLTSKPWRKIFKNSEAMNKWCDENDAEVHASSEVEQPVSEAVTQVLALRKSIFESMHGFKRSFDRLYVVETYMKEAARLVTGEQLSEDVDAINERVARVTEMLGEGVNADAIATVARVVTLEALTQPLSEDEGDGMDLAEDVTPMYKAEIPEDAPLVRAMPPAELTDRIMSDFVENNQALTIEGVDLKGYVVFFFPHFGGGEAIDPTVEAQLNHEFGMWCYELDTELDAEVGSAVMGEDMDDMEEATVRFKVPGHSLGECSNHPAIKQFDNWLESFDPDNMFGGKPVAEDDDMSGDTGEEAVEETFQGKLEDGDTVTITARGDHFGKSAVIAKVPTDPDGVYVVMLAGKPFQISRRNFDAPQLMSVNVAEPEMAMEDMAPPVAQDKWIVFGTMGINGKFKKKFDDEAARDDWIADHENDERFVITGTEDPVMDEGALRVGSRAYNEVSRLASSNIDRTADEKKRAKDIKWKADKAAAEARQRDKGEEVDEDLRPSMFTKPYDGPKQDYSTQIADIEHMNTSVAPGSRDEFNSVLNSCLNIVDPKNEKSIADCVDMLSPERVERLVSELKAIYDATPVHEAFDPEPTAGDTVTVTTAGKYKGKTATVVTVPTNPKDQWVLNVDGEDKKTMRSSFEFKPAMTEGAFRFGFEKSLTEGAMKDLIDQVTEPGWYAFSEEGSVVDGPCKTKFDIKIKYRNDISPYTVLQVSEKDLMAMTESVQINEGKETRYEVTKTKGDRTYKQEGTLAELLKAYSYTLEVGASYSHEKGNSKINQNPKNIAALVKNLNNAVNNSAANGYAGVDFTSKVLGEKVSEAKNHMGENEYGTYTGWKAAAKKADAAVWFDGDKETCNAMVGPNPYKRGETKGIGEWDGEKGSVYKSGVSEGKSFKRNDDDEVDVKAKKKDDQKKRDAKKQPIDEAAMGMSDEVAAKKIADKIKGTPDLTMPKIKAMVTRYLTMVDKAESDVPHLAALVHTELGDMVSEGKTFKRGKDDDAEDKKKSDKERKEGSKQKREQVSEGKETLEDKVARLQKEYADCDDFPTARHEIKAELDKAKKELAASKKVKESVALTAGTFFKLLGESELLFCKSINESKALVTTAEGQEKWFEASSLNIDPNSVRAIKK